MYMVRLVGMAFSISKWKCDFKIAFCICSGHLCLILRFVCWSETFKIDKISKVTRYHILVHLQTQLFLFQKVETLTTSFFIRSIPTVIHKVTELQVLHTCFGVQAVEMRVLGAHSHCRRHRTVLEGDIIKSGDSIEHAEANFSQSNLEGLSDAPQLNGDPVPQSPLIIQGRPYDSFVLNSFESEVYVSSPHRYTWVIMPEGIRSRLNLKLSW